MSRKEPRRRSAHHKRNTAANSRNPLGRAMKPTFFATPAAFRAWLGGHHGEAAELWVGFHKIGSGKPSITWPESVDQALCFGWIDGVRQGIDDGTYAIRFSPRNQGASGAPLTRNGSKSSRKRVSCKPQASPPSRLAAQENPESTRTSRGPLPSCNRMRSDASGPTAPVGSSFTLKRPPTEKRRSGGS